MSKTVDNHQHREHRGADVNIKATMSLMKEAKNGEDEQEVAPEGKSSVAGTFP